MCFPCDFLGYFIILPLQFYLEWFYCSFPTGVQEILLGERRSVLWEGVLRVLKLIWGVLVLFSSLSVQNDQFLKASIFVKMLLR